MTHYYLVRRVGKIRFFYTGYYKGGVPECSHLIEEAVIFKQLPKAEKALKHGDGLEAYEVEKHIFL